MIKELKANGLSSFRDFDLYISNKILSLPKKKIIKETIPFSNDIYDFSKIDGEIYYEERELTIVFDIVDLNFIDFEIQRRKIINWIMNIHDIDIYLDYYPGYHFHGSYEDNSWTEDFDNGELSVKFKVYPYLISNDYKKICFLIDSNEKIIEIVNNSSHRIAPIIYTNKKINIYYNGYNYELEAGTYQDKVTQNDDDFKFEPGINKLKISCEEESEIKFMFKEEVL